MCSVENVQRSNVLQNKPLVPLPNGRCRINQLPPEIFSIIFKHGVDNRDSPEPEDLVEQEQDFCDDDFSSSYLPGYLPFAFLVSRICKLWRNVALEMPSLWTTIGVFNTERPPYERVVAYLERSKSLPLDICLNHISREALWSPSVENDNLKALLTLLVPHLSRWASIRVGVRCYDHMNTFLKAVSDPSVPPATRLEELKLVHNSGLSLQATLSEFKFFPHFTLFGGSAPLLRILVLAGVHIDWSQGWLHSASNLQILHLSFHDMRVRPSWDAFSAILRGAPALKALEVSYSGPRDYPGEPLLLPNLLELDLGISLPREVILLLGKLCTPALKALTLDFRGQAYDYSDLVAHLAGPATQAMLSPIEQPCSLLRSLETLSIKGLSGSAEILYRELVNLKVLKLSKSRVSRSFFELLYPRRLTPSGGGDSFSPNHLQSMFVTFLPSLKNLFLSGASTCDLKRLVVERRNAGVPLGAIFMRRRPPIDHLTQLIMVRPHAEVPVRAILVSPRPPTELSDVVWLRDNLEEFEIIEDKDAEESVDEYAALTGSRRLVWCCRSLLPEYQG